MASRTTSFFSSLTFFSVAYGFLAVVIIMTVFVGLDYIAHSLSDEYAVPTWYFTHKIIYGGLLMVAALVVTRHVAPLWRSSINAIVGALLQIRYAFMGFPTEFVVLFAFVHAVAIFVPTWIVLIAAKKRGVQLF